MLLIYDLLYAHLLQYGRQNLRELVDSAAFRVRRDRIAFSSTRGLTWEKFTSLLLLQRAWHNQRLARRAKTLARRRNGKTFRLPPLPILRLSWKARARKHSPLHTRE
jgi:hypothetical protein